MIDVDTFEKRKENYRITLRRKINKLFKIQHFFIDEKLKLPTFNLNGDNCFSIIDRIIDFNILYPTLLGIYQLIDYLFKSTFIYEGYELLKHIVIFDFAYLYENQRDKKEYDDVKILGYRYEHSIFLLGESNNIFEFIQSVKDSRYIAFDIVSRDIPFNSYLKEVRSFCLDYYFIGKVEDHMNLFINNQVRNDVKFIYSDLLSYLINEDELNVYMESKEKQRGLAILNKVIDIGFNDRGILTGVVLGNNEPVYNCYIEINDKKIISYSCECMAYMKNHYKFCKHLVALYMRFYQIVYAYFDI